MPDEPNPFAGHHCRRYAFAWDALAGRRDRHLDLGCGEDGFLSALSATASLECSGAAPHPGYVVRLSVPRRHLFSFLDPDNAKFRFPRFYQLVYVARFCQDIFSERFSHVSNGLRGDMSADKKWHTNYRHAWLMPLVRRHGFEPVAVEGADFFWRWFQVPGLVTAGRLQALCEYAIYLHGKFFRSANIFIAAERVL